MSAASPLALYVLPRIFTTQLLLQEAYLPRPKIEFCDHANAELSLSGHGFQLRPKHVRQLFENNDLVIQSSNTLFQSLNLWPSYGKKYPVLSLNIGNGASASTSTTQDIAPPLPWIIAVDRDDPPFVENEVSSFSAIIRGIDKHVDWLFPCWKAYSQLHNGLLHFALFQYIISVSIMIAETWLQRTHKHDEHALARNVDIVA